MSGYKVAEVVASRQTAIVRGQRQCALFTALALGAVVAFGIAEYQLMLSSQLAGVESLSLTESAGPTGSGGRSALTLAAQRVAFQYSAHLPVTVCDCAATFTLPSTAAISSLQAVFGADSSCLTLQRGGDAAVDVHVTSHEHEHDWAALALQYVTLSGREETPPPLHLNLQCTARVVLWAGVWEPSLLVSRDLVLQMPAGGAAGVTSSGGEAAAAGAAATQGASLVATASSQIFSTAVAGGIDLSQLLAAGAASWPQLQATAVRVSLRGITLAASIDSNIIAGVQLSSICWDSKDNRTAGVLRYAAGASPSAVLAGLQSRGGVEALLLPALNAALPESMHGVLAQLLGEEEDTDSGGSTAAVQSEPIPVVVWGQALPLPLPDALPLPVLEQMAALDAAAEALRVQLASDAPSPAAPAASEPCPALFAWSHSLFLAAAAESSGLPAADAEAQQQQQQQQACTVGSNMVQLHVATFTLRGNMGGSSSGSGSGEQPEAAARLLRGGGRGGGGRRAQSNTGGGGSGVLVPFSASSATSLLITLLTPEVQISAYSLSGTIDARVATSGSAFLSSAVARLMRGFVGYFRAASRLEVHIPPVWRRGHTDELGNLVSIDPPRQGTLWSTVTCGMAEINVVPFFGTAGVFRLRGSAGLSGLWDCLDAFAREYMVGSHARLPVALREVAIKPIGLPDQPKGSVRMIWPLVGRISLPLGIASRRWLVSRPLPDVLPGDPDLAWPDAAVPDVLPPPALRAHAARMFNDALVLTDLNCSLTETHGGALAWQPQPSPTTPCPAGGVDGSNGRTARAWALSSHPVDVIDPLSALLDAGCAIRDNNRATECGVFDERWRQAGFLGVDGLLLSGECAGGVFDPVRLCTNIEVGSDDEGIAAFGVFAMNMPGARGGGPEPGNQTEDGAAFHYAMDPYAGSGGAVDTGRLSGRMLLRQTTGSSPKLQSGFSGLELASIFRWSTVGGAASGWSGVRITAVNLFAWLRHHVSLTDDGPVYPGSGLGPAPRVDGLACYNASLGGFDVRYNRDCLFTALKPLLRTAVDALATRLTDAFRQREPLTVTSALAALGDTALQLLVAIPGDGVNQLLTQTVSSYWYADAASSAPPPECCDSPSAQALYYIARVPGRVAAAVAGIPVALYTYVGGYLSDLIVNTFRVASATIQGNISMKGRGVGSVTLSANITSLEKLDALEMVETVSAAHNGNPWRFLFRVLCAAHGDATAPESRPVDLIVAGTASVDGVNRLGVPGTVSTSYTLSVGTIVEAIDAGVARWGLALAPAWGADGGFSFTKPATDFVWTVMQQVAYEQAFGGGRWECRAFDGQRQKLTVSTKFRMNGVGTDTGQLATPLLVALRHDIACAAQWDVSQVRVWMVQSVTGTGVWPVELTDAINTATAATLHPELELAVQQCLSGVPLVVRKLQSEQRTLTAGNLSDAVYDVYIALDVPLYMANGRPSPLRTYDAVLLHDRVTWFVGGADVNGSLSSSVPLLQGQASTIDPLFDLGAFTMTSEQMPLLNFVMDTYPIETDNGSPDPDSGASSGVIAAVVVAMGVAFAGAVWRRRVQRLAKLRKLQRKTGGGGAGYVHDVVPTMAVRNPTAPSRNRGI